MRTMTRMFSSEEEGMGVGMGVRVGWEWEEVGERRRGAHNVYHCSWYADNLPSPAFSSSFAHPSALLMATAISSAPMTLSPCSRRVTNEANEKSMIWRGRVNGISSWGVEPAAENAVHRAGIRRQWCLPL